MLLCLEDYGKIFLSSSGCPKASPCPAVWGGISGESYSCPAAAPAAVIRNRGIQVSFQPVSFNTNSGSSLC